MARGNQRDKAREKNQKKLQDLQKKKGCPDKGGSAGASLQARKERDADAMRLKQQKASPSPSTPAASGSQ